MVQLLSTGIASPVLPQWWGRLLLLLLTHHATCTW
jgi:hypothetical protein